MKKISLFVGLSISLLSIALPIAYACSYGTATCDKCTGGDGSFANPYTLNLGETDIKLKFTGAAFEFNATSNYDGDGNDSEELDDDVHSHMKVHLNKSLVSDIADISVSLDNIVAIGGDADAYVTTKAIKDIGSHYEIEVDNHDLQIGEIVSYDLTVTLAKLSAFAAKSASYFVVKEDTDGTNINDQTYYEIVGPDSDPTWTGTFSKSFEKVYSGQPLKQESLTATAQDDDGPVTVTGDGTVNCPASDFTVTYSPVIGVGDPVGVEVVADFDDTDGITTKTCILSAEENGISVDRSFQFTSTNQQPTVIAGDLSPTDGGTELFTISLQDSIGAAFQYVDVSFFNLTGIDEIRKQGDGFAYINGTSEQYDASGDLSLSLEVYYAATVPEQVSFQYEFDDGDNIVTGTIDNQPDTGVRRKHVINPEVSGHTNAEGLIREGTTINFSNSDSDATDLIDPKGDIYSGSESLVYSSTGRDTIDISTVESSSLEDFRDVKGVDVITINSTDANTMRLAMFELTYASEEYATLTMTQSQFEEYIEGYDEDATITITLSSDDGYTEDDTLYIDAGTISDAITINAGEGSDTITLTGTRACWVVVVDDWYTPIETTKSVLAQDPSVTYASIENVQSYLTDTYTGTITDLGDIKGYITGKYSMGEMYVEDITAVSDVWNWSDKMSLGLTLDVNKNNQYLEFEEGYAEDAYSVYGLGSKYSMGPGLSLSDAKYLDGLGINDISIPEKSALHEDAESYLDWGGVRAGISINF